MDPEKIKTIRRWPTQRNVSKVRTFMGLVGYRIFIIGFSNIYHPITSLQKRDLNLNGQ
jgi:hypothetical protein